MLDCNKLIKQLLTHTGSGRDNISLNELTHILPLIAKNRKCCRLIKTKNLAIALNEIFINHSFNVSLVPIDIFNHGTDWQTFDYGNGASEYMMLSIAFDMLDAINLSNAELEGDEMTVGNLLCYPDCCVQSYHKMANYSQYWPNYYFSKNNLTVSKWCNRIPLLSGKFSPTGELFPCNLTCKNAIKLGMDNMKCYDLFELNVLKKEIMNSATQTIHLDNNNIIINSKDNQNYSKSIIPN